MPDLTIEAYYHCQSAENWQTQVPASDGKGSYTVRWDRTSHLMQRETQYAYSCTCKAYQHGKGKPCKHIEQVKASGAHCNWMEFIHGGEVGWDASGNPVCPRCGGPVGAMNWGV